MTNLYQRERLAYTPVETASLLGLGKTKVYEMLQAGELPAVKSGGRWMVPVQRLEDWLMEQSERKEVAG